MAERSEIGETSAPGLRAPLYHRIYLILRQQIVDGSFTDGALLPGEQELAGRFSVSRITARRALDELAGEGLAERLQGRGTFARPPRQPMAPLEARAEGLFDTLLAMGLTTTAEVLEFDYRAATPEIAQRLEIAPGAEVQRAVRVRRLDGAPLSHLTTWLPGEIGRSFDAEDLSKVPLLQLLEAAGLHPESAEQTITAVLADAEIAPLLATDVGTPLLRISRLVRDAGKRPVEWLTALYRPDRFQHRMTLQLTRNGHGRSWQPVRSDPARPHPGRNNDNNHDNRETTS